MKNILPFRPLVLCLFRHDKRRRRAAAAILEAFIAQGFATRPTYGYTALDGTKNTVDVTRLQAFWIASGDRQAKCRTDDMPYHASN